MKFWKLRWQCNCQTLLCLSSSGLLSYSKKSGQYSKALNRTGLQVKNFPRSDDAMLQIYNRYTTDIQISSMFLCNIHHCITALKMSFWQAEYTSALAGNGLVNLWLLRMFVITQHSFVPVFFWIFANSVCHPQATQNISIHNISVVQIP